MFLICIILATVLITPSVLWDTREMLLPLPPKHCCGQRRIHRGCDFPHQLWEAAPKVAQALRYFNTGLVLLLFQSMRISWCLFKWNQDLWGLGSILGQQGKVMSFFFFNRRRNSSTLKAEHLESEMPELRPCVQFFFSFACVCCNTAYIMMFCFLQETPVLSDVQGRQRVWQDHVWDELVSIGSFLPHTWKWVGGGQVLRCGEKCTCKSWLRS